MSLQARQKHGQKHLAVWLSLVVGLLCTPLSLAPAASAPAVSSPITPKGSLPHLSAVELCSNEDNMATATVRTGAGVQTVVMTLHSAKLRQWTVHQVIPGEVASLDCFNNVTADALVLTRAGQLWTGAPGQLRLQPQIRAPGERPLLAMWLTYARNNKCLNRVKYSNGYFTPWGCPSENEMRTHILIVSTNDDEVRPQTFFQVLDRQGRQVRRFSLRDVGAIRVWDGLSPQGYFQVLATAGSLRASPALGKHDVVVLEVDPARRTSVVLQRVGSEAEEEATVFGINADSEVVVGGQTRGAVNGRYGGQEDAFLTDRNAGRDWTVQLNSAQTERFDALFPVGDVQGSLCGLIFGQVAGRPAVWKFQVGTDQFTRVPLPANYPTKEVKVFRLFNEKVFLAVGTRQGKVTWALLPFSP